MFQIYRFSDIEYFLWLFVWVIRIPGDIVWILNENAVGVGLFLGKIEMRFPIDNFLTLRCHS